jgi:DNA-binding winged helix-turn-helix (wHTH) protein
MIPLGPGPLHFGLFELNPISGELRKQGLRVKLTPQAMALLCLLLEPPVRMRTRKEIQQRLWPANTFVDFEHGLNKVVHSLREALGEPATNPRFIETIAANGYRFLPQFVEQSAVAADPRSFTRVGCVAVLPIATKVEEKLSFLGSRITSCLIDEISAIDGVRVIAEGTVKSHNLEGADPQRAGESLGVRAVLSGELTQRDTALFLRMELIDVADGAQLCGAHVEQIAQPGKHCEDEFSREILRQIKPVLMLSSAKVKVVDKPVLMLERRVSSDRRLS